MSSIKIVELVNVVPSKVEMMTGGNNNDDEIIAIKNKLLCIYI